MAASLLRGSNHKLIRVADLVLLQVERLSMAHPFQSNVPPRCDALLNSSVRGLESEGAGYQPCLCDATTTQDTGVHSPRPIFDTATRSEVRNDVISCPRIVLTRIPTPRCSSYASVDLVHKILERVGVVPELLKEVDGSWEAVGDVELEAVCLHFVLSSSEV